MPKIVNHDVRRAAIAQAVWRVIVDKGIAGCTTREIAREAGVSIGTLANDLGDKDGMVLAAFEVLLEGFEARLTAAAAGVASPRQAMEKLIMASMPLDAARRIESGVWMSFWAYGYSNERLRKKQSEQYDRWVNVLASLVKHGQAAGEFRAELKPAMVANELAVLSDGLVVQLLMRDGRSLPPRTAVAIVREHIARLGR